MEALARLTIRRRWAFVVLWLLLTIAGAVAAGKLADRWFEQFSIPGYSAYEANQRTLQTFGTGRQYPMVLVFSIKDGEDVTLTGKGTIEGNGSVWWEAAEEARKKVSGFTLPRPNLIVPTRIKNLRISGITIQNSPKFHLVPTECEDVWIEGIKILAPERAANTDAIDPSICRNVTVTNCLKDVGDDNIAIKSGKKVEGREFACENITITDCVIHVR